MRVPLPVFSAASSPISETRPLCKYSLARSLLRLRCAAASPERLRRPFASRSPTGTTPKCVLLTQVTWLVDAFHGKAESKREIDRLARRSRTSPMPISSRFPHDGEEMKFARPEMCGKCENRALIRRCVLAARSPKSQSLIKSDSYSR